MKKLTLFTVWLVLAVVLTFSPPASADIIMPNTHPVDRSVKIVNLNEFPNLVVIAYVRGPVDSWPTEQYIITNNMYLTKGTYKHNRFDVLWEIRDKSNPINLPIVPKHFAVEDIQPYGGYVDDTSHLVKEEIEYSIAGFVDGKLVIYESRHTSEFNDGTPVKVQTFDNPVPNASLQPPEPNLESVVIPPQPVPNPELIETPVPLPQPPSPPLSTAGPAPPEPIKEGFWQSMSYERQFLFALLLTLIIEIPVAILLVKALYKRREIGISTIILIGFVASALTLPYLWFILPVYISNRALYIWIGEASVILVEWLIYFRFLKLRLLDAGVVSLVANVASVVVGLVVFCF